MEMGKHLTGKQMLAGPCRDAETGLDSDLQALLSPPRHTQPVLFVDTGGDSSSLGMALSLRSLRQLSGIKPDVQKAPQFDYYIGFSKPEIPFLLIR